MLAASSGLRAALGQPRPRARLCRKPHVRSSGARTALRCRAQSEGRPHGSADEAALQTLMMKLREDDVEYFELKTKCREWGLGGKDNKDNLRAKLLRKVRQELGLPVFGPDSVPPGAVRLPQDMTPDELRHLFDSRGCMMPAETWQALSMANALLVADGLLAPEEVIIPDEPEDDYSRMTVVELRAKCVSRKLAQVGLKQQLIQRLREYDAKLVAEAEEHAHFEAAAAEAGAAEGVAPTATNNAALHALQELFANMKNMEVAALREALAQRHVNTQGTRQILMAKLTEELKKDVARALGGERRLAQWAASAVARMEDAEVLHELEVRQVAQFGSPDEARQVLQAQMQKDWVEEALHVQAVQHQATAKQQAAGAGSDGAEDDAAAWGAGWGDNGAEAAAAAEGGAWGGEAYAQEPATGMEEQQAYSGREGDPVLSVALLCGGHAQPQREAALAAARMAAHCLQSDRSHGLVPAARLAAGEDAARQGVALQAIYALDGRHFPLSWEALYSGSAAELDARLALQPEAAVDAAAALAAADAVVPLGLGAECPQLLAAAGGKVAGSCGGEAAALAADRLAFAGKAGELGFATVPAHRLRLADFSDAAGASELADMAVFQLLEQFLEEQQLPLDAAPRLAVRAEAAGSVLGGALVSGPRNALLAALELMQEFSVGEVLVEAVVPGARHFTCSVLATEQGAVALPPTELDTWDVEDEIVASELALERHLAMREGLDPEGVEALLSVIQQEQGAHPGYLGGKARPSQQLRQSTPPAGLSAEATESVRQASLALFQRLGLRDYAQFSGWVLPPRPVQDAAAAAAAEAAAQAAADQEEQRPRGKSFAELAALDADLRAELEAAATSVSAADRAAAVDTTAGAADAAGSADEAGSEEAEEEASASEEQPEEAGSEEAEVEVAAASEEPSSLLDQLLAAELESAEAEAQAEAAQLAQRDANYGVYNGISIDSSYRLTTEQAMEVMAPYQRPIPLSAPKPPVVEALQDLSSADPRQLCTLPSSGQTVAFAQLSVVPDLGSPTSVLCQQAAAVGLSQEALLRMLVSAAAVRGGAPALPSLPEAAAAAEERAAAAAEAAAAAAPEAAAAEGEEGDDASGAQWTGDGSVWGTFGALGDAEWDRQGVQELLDQPIQFASWGPPGEEGAEHEEGQQQAAEDDAAAAAAAAGQLDNPFEFVDASADPALDPALAAQQQAAWEEQQAAEGLGLPYGYDEIREDDFFTEAAAHVHVEDPADLQDGGLGGSNLEHMHPTKQRVWVLLGGDGPLRTQSLQAGLHAYLSLRQHPELLVEAYLLEPNSAGTKDVERRQRCLERRLELRKMGFEEDWIQEEQTPYSLARIRNPAALASEANAELQSVWRLSDTGLLRAEVEDLEAACEAALEFANASLPTLEDRGGDIAGTQLSVARQELELAGVPLDGSAWGGAPAHRLLPAQYMMLRRFAEQAQDCGAVVFMALGGQQLAHGPVQRLFEELGVPFTGCFSMQSELCADKATLREQLLDLDSSGISVAPQQKISLPELVAQCDDEQSAARLFDQLLTSLAGGAAALCIKPATAMGDPSLGAMRAASGRDLMVYVQAVQQWVDTIPGALLDSDSPDVPMPLPPPSAFVVEPFVTTEPVQLVRGADGALVPPPPGAQTYPDAAAPGSLEASLHWLWGGNQWMRVDAVVLGETGRMRCLGPTVRVQQMQEEPLAAAPGSAAAALQRAQQLALEAAAAEAFEEDDEEEAEELLAVALAAAEAAAAAAADPAAPTLRRQVGAFDLTPPPACLALPEAVRSARVRLEIVADRLALRGVAEISAYMHYETGELVVVDVCTLPDLSPAGLVFKQAAADGEAPLPPAGVFYELIRVAASTPMVEAGDTLGALGFPELTEEAADYDYPQDSEYVPYDEQWGPYEQQEPQQWSSST